MADISLEKEADFAVRHIIVEYAHAFVHKRTADPTTRKENSYGH
jgi:hypothetical protein